MRIKLTLNGEKKLHKLQSIELVKVFTLLSVVCVFEANTDEVNQTERVADRMVEGLQMENRL